MKLKSISENMYDGLEDSDVFSSPQIIDVTNRVAAEHYASLDPDDWAQIVLAHPDSNAWQYKGMTLNGDEMVVDIS